MDRLGQAVFAEWRKVTFSLEPKPSDEMIWHTVVWTQQHSGTCFQIDSDSFLILHHPTKSTDTLTNSSCVSSDMSRYVLFVEGRVSKQYIDLKDFRIDVQRKWSAADSHLSRVAALILDRNCFHQNQKAVSLLNNIEQLRYISSVYFYWVYCIFILQLQLYLYILYFLVSCARCTDLVSNIILSFVCTNS